MLSRLSAFSCLLSTGLFSAVEKVEPPSWWAGGSIRLLITGDGLRPDPIRTGSPHLQISAVHAGLNGKALFADLKIHPAARPGVYALRTSAGEIPFEILATLPRAGRFQGFGAADVIYLAMIDRFSDGDASNNDALTDRQNPRFYHGGDFAGLTARLPYLKELGITALWLTPVYGNANEAAASRYGLNAGYHGYGATEFYAAEEHFGTIEELRALVDAAHAAGIKVLLDMVANHAGAGHRWAEAPPLASWLNPKASQPPGSPWQLWALGDPTAARHAKDAVLKGWFAGALPDLNQEEPEVARHLIQNALWWIGRTGIDGIRADTVAYVPQKFWREWHAAIKREYPRLRTVGEVYHDDPLTIAGFEQSGFDFLFDFPLYFAARAVLARGSERLGHIGRILAQDRLYRNPGDRVTFLGSHDFKRIRTEASGSLDRVKQAFTFLFTMRGIPLVYYGDEIGLEGEGDPDNRRDFPGGWRDDARSAFEPSQRTQEQSALFEHVQRLIALRRSSIALQSGRLVQLAAGDAHYVFARIAASESVVTVFGEPGPIDLESTGLPRQAEADDALGSGRRASIKEGILDAAPGVYRFRAGSTAPVRR